MYERRSLPNMTVTFARWLGRLVSGSLARPSVLARCIVLPSALRGFPAATRRIIATAIQQSAYQAIFAAWCDKVGHGASRKALASEGNPARAVDWRSIYTARSTFDASPVVRHILPNRNSRLALRIRAV